MSKQVDYKLFFLVVTLIIFGMIMISSVSVYSSFKVTTKLMNKGLISEVHNHFYVFRNIIHVIIGFFVLGILVKIPYRFYEKNAVYIFSFSLALMIIVLVLGEVFKGARGWISIPGIPFMIQPTEFLKIGFIIYLSYYLKKTKHLIHTFHQGFLPFLFILGTVVFLIALQPDFGTIAVLAPVATIMFFIAGANVKYIGTLVLAGILLIVSVYSIGDYDKETGKRLNKFGYITQRIDKYLADEKESIKNGTMAHQTKQGLIAIGSGGFRGLGFGKSIQKFGHLPEVQGDFIFSAIVEELGFIGGTLLVLAYFFILYKGVWIANNSKDSFAKFLAIGITSRFVLQAFINIGVNLNLVPVTGITLPFISYGGSSLLSSIIGLSILLNVSRYVEVKDKNTRNKKRIRIMNILESDN